MEDRELLELAAMADGRKWLHYAKGSGKGLCCRDDSYGGLIEYYWNPLEDDGDALRLAVKLMTSIDFAKWSHTVFYDTGKFCQEEWKDKDQYAATRRAIVRAAAEIGKSLTTNN